MISELTTSELSFLAGIDGAFMTSSPNEPELFSKINT